MSAPLKPNLHPTVWDLVLADMRARDQAGTNTLQPYDGTDFLWESYQHMLDLCVRLRGAIYERDNNDTS